MEPTNKAARLRSSPEENLPEQMKSASEASVSAEPAEYEGKEYRLGSSSIPVHHGWMSDAAAKTGRIPFTGKAKKCTTLWMKFSEGTVIIVR